MSTASKFTGFIALLLVAAGLVPATFGNGPGGGPQCDTTCKYVLQNYYCGGQCVQWMVRTCALCGPTPAGLCKGDGGSYPPNCWADPNNGTDEMFYYDACNEVCDCNDASQPFSVEAVITGNYTGSVSWPWYTCQSN